MWAFVLVVGLFLAAAISRPNIPQAQKFDGELEFPTVDEGQPIPVIFGTVDLKSPNVVWWGDWIQRPIKKDGERIGYYQWAGVHMVFCHGPIDALLGIYGGRDKVIWEGQITSNQTIWVRIPKLYGHNKTGEGGVKGNIAIQFGGPNQTKNAYLEAQQGLTTANRGVFGLILEHCWLGNTKAPKPWWVRAQRIHTTGRDGVTQWYDEKAQIGTYDMNPAHIVRECLLDTDWGAGEDPNSLAPGNFEAMADLYYAEGVGLSMKWAKKGDVYKFIESVLQQCNSVLYQDPSDGLLYLKAIRDDYDKANLPVVSRKDGNIIEIRKLSRPAPAEQVNTLTAKYIDRERNEKASFTLEDQAAVELYGPVAGEIDYPGIRDETAVAEALARDLAVASRSLRSCSVVCNRDAANFTLGDPFILDDFLFNLEMVVMRVTEIDYGGSKRGEVTIGCVEDVFSAPAPFKYIPPSNWTPPETQPQEVTTGEVVHLPRYLAATGLGSDWSSVDTSTQVVYGLLAQIPAEGMSDYDMLLDSDGDGTFETEAGPGAFAATLTLGAAIGVEDTTLPVGAFTLSSQITTNDFLVVNGEWMRVTAPGSASVEVTRAILDTVPRSHNQGDLAYVVNPEDEAFPVIPMAIAWDNVIAVKPLVIASEGQLEDATPIGGPASVKRLLRPLPPGNFSINGVVLPDSTEHHVGDISLAWSQRAYGDETSELAGWFATGSWSSGNTHYVEVWNGDKTIQGTTLTGSTNVNYTKTQEEADFGTLQESLTFVLYCEDGSGNRSETFEWVSYRDPMDLNPPLELDGTDDYVDLTE